MRLRFTIRDLLWLVVVVAAVLTTWIAIHRQCKWFDERPATF